MQNVDFCFWALLQVQTTNNKCIFGITSIARSRKMCLGLFFDGGSW